MRLKKSYASYKDETGNWVPQKDVEMHPLEEALIRADWALNELKDTLIPASPQQEQEWLIEHGVEYVREQRTLFKEKVEKVTPDLHVLHDKFRDCEKKWHAHIERCLKHDLDSDIADTEHLE